jgi:hypothetical protein
VVENACERPLFASPEAVAAAVEYVDARFSLLAPSAALAARDPSYQPVFERLRRGLETDRYGLVAHVLLTRGCTGADCAELRLLRDPARVVANMKARTFESSLGVHTLAWQSGGTGPAMASTPPLTTNGASIPIASGGPGAIAATGSASAGSSKFDFPSANSIPAVSIMNPEPGAPATAEPRAPAPPKRAASQSRRQGAREAAAPAPLPSPSPPPPAPAAQVAPEAAPAEPAPSARPDLHSTR